MLDQLDEAERERSDETYLALRRKYSDVVIHMRAVREAFSDLSTEITGSRLGGPSSVVTIMEPGAGSSVSGDALFQRLKRRMQDHLDQVTALLGIDRIEARSVTAAKLSDLEEQVDEYVRRLNAR